MVWPTYQGIVDNLFSSFLIFVWGLMVAVVLTLWTGYVYPNTPIPLLVVFWIGVYGLVVWSLNQTKILLHGRQGEALAEMSPENLIETMRKWLDDFQFQIRREGEDETKYFSFVVRGKSDNPVEVMRLRKVREQFILLRCFVRIDPEHVGKLNSLSQQDLHRVLFEIAIELNRQKISHSLDIPRGIHVEARVSIVGLTQEVFIDKINDVDFAINLIIGKIRLLLDYPESLHNEESLDSKPPSPSSPVLLKASNTD